MTSYMEQAANVLAQLEAQAPEGHPDGFARVSRTHGRRFIVRQPRAGRFTYLAEREWLDEDMGRPDAVHCIAAMLMQDDGLDEAARSIEFALHAFRA